MSRANYSEDLDNWDLIRWRGQVASAIRGKRGQGFLGDLLVALDSLPEKRLIADDLENEEGEVCAIGALGKARGIDMKRIDPEEPEVVAAVFGIAEQLAREIVYMNDEYFDTETPEERHRVMRKWVIRQIRPTSEAI
jgi:hypothetical protein